MGKILDNNINKKKASEIDFKDVENYVTEVLCAAHPDKDFTYQVAIKLFAILETYSKSTTPQNNTYINKRGGKTIRKLPLNFESHYGVILKDIAHANRVMYNYNNRAAKGFLMDKANAYLIRRSEVTMDTDCKRSEISNIVKFINSC